MSPAAIITIAVVVIVVLAAHRARHSGSPRRCSRRWCAQPRDAPPRQGRRDRSARRRNAVATSSAQSAEARGTDLVPAAPIDTRGVGAARRGRHRRQPPPVPQPGHRFAHRRRPHHVRRGRLRRLPVADRHGRVRRQDQRRQDRRRHRPASGPAVASSTTRRHARGSRSTRSTPFRRRRACRRTSRCSTGMENGSGRPVPEVPAPRLPRAAVRQQPVVRVPVPRLAVQPRRREEGRPRPAWHGSLRVRRCRTAGDVVIDTGTVCPGPPIGTNTTGQEAEGPHCIGGTGGHG